MSSVLDLGDLSQARNILDCMRQVDYKGQISLVEKKDELQIIARRIEDIGVWKYFVFWKHWISSDEHSDIKPSGLAFYAGKAISILTPILELKDICTDKFIREMIDNLAEVIEGLEHYRSRFAGSREFQVAEDIITGFSLLRTQFKGLQNNPKISSEDEETLRKKIESLECELSTLRKSIDQSAINKALCDAYCRQIDVLESRIEAQDKKYLERETQLSCAVAKNEAQRQLLDHGKQQLSNTLELLANMNKLLSPLKQKFDKGE